MTRDYDSTIARIAGDLLSGDAQGWLKTGSRQSAVEAAVATARAIVAETRRTEPEMKVIYERKEPHG